MDVFIDSIQTTSGGGNGVSDFFEKIFRTYLALNNAARRRSATSPIIMRIATTNVDIDFSNGGVGCRGFRVDEYVSAGMN